MDSSGWLPGPKRIIKDSVFKALFGRMKYLRQLYQALHPEAAEVEDSDFKYVTINNVLTDNLYNDLGFMVGDRLIVMVEAQSTWSPSIALRAMLYVLETLKRHINATGIDIYDAHVRIPDVEVYLLYTGRRKLEKGYLSFAEIYGTSEKSGLDLRVNIIGNMRADASIIGQYRDFTAISDEQVSIFGRTNRAIRETLRICGERNILREFLTDHQSEVMDIMETLFDEDTIFRRYVNRVAREAREKARAEGMAEGRVMGHAAGRAEGRAEGMAEGIARARAEADERVIHNTVSIVQELGFSVKDAVARVMADHNYSEAEAIKKVEQYWKK